MSLVSIAVTMATLRASFTMSTGSVDSSSSSISYDGSSAAQRDAKHAGELT
jgi:hypothetical protein